MYIMQRNTFVPPAPASSPSVFLHFGASIFHAARKKERKKERKREREKERKKERKRERKKERKIERKKETAAASEHDTSV
jgi:flagellar biosynthesis component FlhA